MKISITFLLIWFSISAHSEKIEFFEGSPEVAFQKAAKENKLIFVDFYASWCKPCKQLERRTFKNKELALYLNEHFINLKVDVDAPNPFFQALMKGKLKVIPYLAFFSPSRDQLGAIEGYVDANTLYDYADTLNNEYLAMVSRIVDMDKKAEAIALDLCIELETFTSVALQLDESTEGTKEFHDLYARFEREMELAEIILQGLDKKMGTHLNSQYFIDQFGKSLQKNCSNTFRVMQYLVE